LLSEEERFVQHLRKTDYTRYKEYILLRDVNDSLKALASYRTLSKGIVTRSVDISSTPVKLIQASQDRSYTIVNPTAAIGLTTDAQLYGAGTVLNADGNSQSTPIYVANYDSLHLHMNVTAVGGAPAVDVFAQTYDPLSATWVDVQAISPPGGIATTGNYYSFFSGLGINGRFALRWATTGAWGSLTLSIGYTLKNGLGGNSAGTAQTVFLGNQNVTRFTGYPLLEGQYRDWYMRENAELFGVCQSGTVTVNIIEYI
jgi:hypothetical protein